jgi:hypothetical protein
MHPSHHQHAALTNGVIIQSIQVQTIVQVYRYLLQVPIFLPLLPQRAPQDNHFFPTEPLNEGPRRPRKAATQFG